MEHIREVYGATINLDTSVYIVSVFLIQAGGMSVRGEVGSYNGLTVAYL
jgi:hypothetical protein